MPNKQLIKHSWKPQMQTIPIKFSATDMQALKILRDCLGTPDTTRTVRAALGAAVSMVTSLMNQNGFTDSSEFRTWWLLKQAEAAARTEGSAPPMGGSEGDAHASVVSDATGPVVEAHGPGDSTDAYQPTHGDDTTATAQPDPDVAAGAPVP